MIFKINRILQIATGFLGIANAAGVIKVPVTSKMVALTDNSGPLSSVVNKIVTTVKAGNNQAFKDVLVDTGSGVLWVGAEDKYVPGANTNDIHQNFSIQYGVGGASGPVYLDRVSIGDAVVNSQFIGASSQVTGLKAVRPLDGVLGLGPSQGNAGQITGYNYTPTFVESLVAEGTISQPIFGFYLGPSVYDDVPEGLGEITFGGVDESRIKGDITWVPQTSDSFHFRWGFNVSGLSWGSKKLLDGPTPSLTDSGVMGIDIPFDSLYDIVHAVPGAVVDLSNGFLSFSANITADSLPDLNIGIGGVTFGIPPSTYLVPKSLYPALNLTNDLTHSWIGSGGPGSFMLGQHFLEAVYSAYDMGNNRIGFAHLA